jgi:hypothetical protein
MEFMKRMYGQQMYQLGHEIAVDGRKGKGTSFKLEMLRDTETRSQSRSILLKFVSRVKVSGIRTTSASTRTHMSESEDCALATMEWKNGVPVNLRPHKMEMPLAQFEQQAII